MTTIRTLDAVRIITAPAVKVYISDTLDSEAFTEVDQQTGEETALVENLWVNRLRMVVAPQVDVCELQFEYGEKLNSRSGEFQLVEPLEIVDKWVKVVIGKTLDTDKEIEWYGRIKHEHKQIFGGGVDGASPTGIQYFTALGLLHLLDEHTNNVSVIEEDAAAQEARSVKGAIPFNLDQGGVYPETGNRSEFLIDGTYVFSKQIRSRFKWNAAEAVEYLLKYHTPAAIDAVEVTVPWVEWRLIAPADSPERSYLEWYEVSVDREERTTKQILDELINRKRGVGYFVRFDPKDPNDQYDVDSIGVYLFNSLANDLTLPSETIIQKNQNRFSMDFENAFDVIESSVSDVATNAFTHVRAFGEYQTVTFTNKFASIAYDDDDPENPLNMFVKGWTDEQATKFNEGASKNADGTPNTTYGNLPRETQALWNSFARNSDKLSNVFRRFMINPDWDQLCTGPHDAAALSYYAFPRIPEYSDDPDEDELDPEQTDDPLEEVLRREPVENRRIKVLPYTPFKDQNDYTEDKIFLETFEGTLEDFQIPQYIPVMVYARVGGGGGQEVRDDNGDIVEDPPRYELVEKLNYGAFDDNDGRRWGCSVACPSDGPYLQVSAHPPQMIAGDEFSESDAETAESQLPSENNGLDWKNDLFVTLTCQHPRRVQKIVEIGEHEDGTVRNEVAIYVRDARCDYVLPYTTVALQYGLPEVSTLGGYVRNDRQRVADIARAAAEWYGQKRKTLNLTLKQTRMIAELGWLIIDIGANYTTADEIHTPITAIEYQFPAANAAPSMRIETSYHDMDFA